MVDQVKVVADDQAPAEQSLRRNLTNRHIQLIAIGGAIGTGLFMGSGKTISLAGPSIIFVFLCQLQIRESHVEICILGKGIVVSCHLT